jgi:hypothetical protein
MGTSNRGHWALIAIGISLVAPMAARADETPDDKRRPEIPGAVYDKPFLKRLGHGAALGGYIDLELLADENGSTFDQHRFVPFIYAQVSDRVSVASEIEFEHGGAVAGDEETDGEIKVEFAHVDLSASDWLNFRAGVLLTPLGRFNLVHDSPANDLTDRPLVSTQIIPTTLSESGFGIFGTTYPSESSVVTYEAYLVNGFNEGILESTGVDEFDVRIREGRGSAKRDNNNNRALVGRIGFSPSLGVDVGASVHHGRYTDADQPSENLTIAAFDGITSFGPLELQGEFAVATIGVPEEVSPESMKQNGFYAQGSYHFLPGAVHGLPNSVFTGIVRFDQVDFDTNDEGERDRRLTVGLNFRPTEETAVKFDVNRTWQAPAGSSTDSSGFDALRFSIASYF